MRIIEQLVYKITGDNSEFDKSIDKSETKVNKFGSVADKMLAGVTVAAIGMVIKKTVEMGKGFVDSYSKFESGLAKVSTLFGDVNVNMDTLSKGVLKVSSNTGMLSDEINEALYSALSAGVEVTEDMSSALELVESSSKLARAGFTDTDTALSATIKTINAYKLGLDDTDRIQRILMQTQNKGITTVGELGQNLAKVTPTAAAFGYSFENVGAAIATMTAQGMQTEIATTYLAQIMTELGKSGTTASEGLKNAAESAGLAETDAKSLTESGMSLGDILDLLDTYAKNSGKSLVDMFGSVEAGKGALALTGSNLETFNSNLESMSTNADLVGEGFTTMAETVEGQTKILKANIESIRINMGKKLLPAANSVIGGMVTLSDKMLGQDSASKSLKASYENLTTAAQNYNSVLESGEGKTDALTLAMIAQAEAARGVALALVGSEYDDAKKKSAGYEKTIANLSKAMENESIATKSYTDTLGISLDELANSSLTEQTITGKLLDSRKFSNDQI
ncbi:MAG: phage tail tape measure protein, partial [Sphaerochaetaceae bacterium]|nr:phage tail tape measure protein [Sphaerochaetaceae bacterium]